jgi:hypothetical protein
VSYIWTDGVWLNILLTVAFLFLSIFVLGFSGNSRKTFFILILTGISILYCVICPPFQAPDEPDHFLTLTAARSFDSLTNEALTLAQRSLFQEIKFRQDVHFSAEDVNNPSSADWASHVSVAHSLEHRSPLAFFLWKHLPDALGDLDASNALLTLRLFNATLLAFSFALFIWLTPKEILAPLCLLIIAIPTLPFFSMHWSNYILLIGPTIVSIGFLIRGIYGTQMKPYYFFIWGLISCLLFASGVAGVPGWFANYLLAAFVIILTNAPSLGFINMTAFVATGALFIIPLSGSSFLHPVMVAFNTIPIVNKTQLTTSSFAFALIICSVFSVIAVTATTWVARKFEAIVLTGLRYIPWIARLELLLFILFCLTSLKVAVSPIPDIETGTNNLSGISYAAKAIKVMIASLGLGASDGLLVKTFWGGFGWLDSMPSEAFFHLMRLGPTIGICLLLAFASTGRAAKSWVWLHLGALVSGLYLILLAVGTSRAPANLHGRYMVGFYLIMLSFAWLGFLELYRSLSPNRRQLMVNILVTVALATHVYCWCHLLVRYFG